MGDFFSEKLVHSFPFSETKLVEFLVTSVGTTSRFL